IPSACPELGWVLTARTVSDMDVATERTWMCSQRVLAIDTRPGSPPFNRVGQKCGKPPCDNAGFYQNFSK
ncbi:MAG: hypothetical protein WBM36_00970, partial [Lysobacterales bacterium]